MKVLKIVSVEDHKKNIEELLNDSSFIRWLEGNADPTEARKWNRWVQKSEHNRRLALRAQENVLGIAFKEPTLPDVQAEWNKVKHDINQKKQKESVIAKLNATRRGWDPANVFFKIAAVLLIGAFLSFVVYLYQDSTSVNQEIAIQTVQTDYGETKTINLSDGSRIILAANAQLSHKENWLKEPVKRLRLEGEAFFAISPQQSKEHPKLVVETEDGTASVWGTQFTVDTYGKGTRVVLEEGEVRVRTTKEEEATISPGQMATFHQASQKILLENVNPRVYTSWSTNELFFDNTPLSVLVDRIERTYGLNVKVQDAEILNKKLSGSVDFKSLDGLTNAVAEIFDMQIEQSGENLVINYNKNK